MKTQTWIRFLTVGILLETAAWAAGRTASPASNAPDQPGVAPTPPASQPASSPQPGARLEINPTRFDFGEVWQSEPVAGRFTVKNVGTEPLTITIKRSCGCTPVTEPKSPLAPGEADTFSISYDTAKRQGQANQRVTLITNDPNQPKVTIQVVGNVKPLFTSRPAGGLVFHRLTSDRQVTKKMSLTSTYDEPLKLRLKEGQNFGPFDVQFQELKPGREFELAVTTKPPLDQAVSRTQVILETGLAHSPEVQIPVHVYVQPDVTCRPSLLRVSRQAMVAVPRALRLTCRADKPVRITEVRPSAASIKFEVSPPKPARSSQDWLEQLVRVTLPPGDQLPPGDASLEILTDSSEPLYQKFTIPIEVVEASPAAQTPRTAPESEEAAKP